MEAVLFYILAVILVTFSILTVTARNPVRSALYLVSALLAIAGLFFLLKAEFLGAVQVLVYVGGIMVLFLFVIMLVSVREVENERKVSRQWKTAVILVVVLSVELLFFVIRGSEVLYTQVATKEGIMQGQTYNTQWVGRELYTTYLLPFEMASVVLLVAMIGAVILSKREL